MFFHKNEDESFEKGDGPAPSLPLLPLRDIVVFPRMVVPLFVGRERSIRALEAAMAGKKQILLAAQRHANTNEPGADDLYEVGTLSTIQQLLKLPDGTVKVLIEGKRRARIKRFVPNENFFLCEFEALNEKVGGTVEASALVRSIKETFDQYVRLNKRVPQEVVTTVSAIEDPARLADSIIIHLGSVKLADRQSILEMENPDARLEKLFSLMNAELEILRVEKKIRSRVKQQMEKSQKEYYLNEQMQAIQRELGERDESKNELSELDRLADEVALSQEADQRVRKEIKKLKLMPPMSPEATVVRGYVDWILNLPWGKKKEENRDVKRAAEILDKDHYGLKEPKERILEFLAVHALTDKLSGPILCLVGPPGVGKTSLGRSIARATDRDFVRLSLGGVRDEAEIRGHRRTYIGALPGRIIQSLKKAGSNNPVFLLDEIDKMSSDFRGDPAAALLEVLDPEQNETFSDHYLEVEYDLSDVMFVTTANTLSGIPLPLRDRMEIIELAGYTQFEKERIANQYLVPRQLEKNGISDRDITFEKDAIKLLMHRYTRESGVRNLEREIGSVCRKIARKVVEEDDFDNVVSVNVVRKLLGPPRFHDPRRDANDRVGLTNGLAVTGTGGTLLECEAVVVPGEGKLVITGLLEKGMQESGKAAMSYVRSRQKALGLAPDFHKTTDLHVHFPEFVSKDGPSAGVTMVTSIASALMEIPVRNNVAMTGEITLRGRVMPIGGLKSKLLAAHRVGIDTVIVPEENEKDLHDVPEQVLDAMRIIFVSHMDQVLAAALALNDPDALFGGRVSPAELAYGKRIPLSAINSPRQTQ